MKKFAPPNVLETIRTRDAIHKVRQSRAAAPRPAHKSAALGLLMNELSGGGGISMRCVRVMYVCMYKYAYVLGLPMDEVFGGG